MAGRALFTFTLSAFALDLSNHHLVPGETRQNASAMMQIAADERISQKHQ
jgi:hypothetical protein